MWVVPAETVQNMDVLDAPTGMYSRHVSAGTTHSAANAAVCFNETAANAAGYHFETTTRKAFFKEAFSFRRPWTNQAGPGFKYWHPGDQNGRAGLTIGGRLPGLASIQPDEDACFPRSSSHPSTSE